MAGLAPATLRLGQDNLGEPANDGPGVIVETDDDQGFTSDGPVVEITHSDGSVTISLDGRPIEAPRDTGPQGWFDNLADKIDPMEIGRIAEELLRGISDDIASRAEWVEDRAQGVKLLGLKIEVPGLQGAADGAPVEGMSKVRHPLLLEAVLRFQANARSELLPTDGPVKVRNDTTGAPPPGMGHNGGPSLSGSTPEQDQLANALEKDLNHYLTAVATEYYPDTDRMLLMLGFGGTSFKKVYFCPLRNRPVSETVDAPDLIVNNAATDLKNAKRVTHRVMMRPSTVKRLQILGVYRDIDLSTPLPQQQDSLQREEANQQGIQPDTMNPEDRDREIYECYCELDIKGFEHQHKGKPSGLEIPYRVTIDLSSREILSIVRNYDEDTKELPEPRETFVKYTFVPGLGFYDIGLLNILGNTTNALTAAWREMLDNGMYANFPGFLLADVGARQNTNIFRVPPGGGALVKTGGMALKDAVMPLPYQTTGQAALQSLTTDMAQTGMRIGGTSEQQVGEGRADAPVGTTLAMIEQATKVLNAVHKRMHAAQAHEFQLLVGCFREHPESFVDRKCKSGNAWTEQTFIAALNDCELVPQADPNTASHGQRMMKIQALNAWAQANQSLADPIAIGKLSLQALGFSDPDSLMAPPSAMGQPPPELIEAQAKVKTEEQKADADTTRAQASMLDAQTRAKGLGAANAGPQQQEDTPVDQAMARAKLMAAETDKQKLGLQAHEIALEDANRDQDRAARGHEQLIELAKEIALKHVDMQRAVRETKQTDRELGT